MLAVADMTLHVCAKGSATALTSGGALMKSLQLRPWWDAAWWLLKVEVAGLGGAGR
jgi:hypothetical protein